jgi:uncharacterized membrane protein YcaP (DUF421 family)
MDTVIRTFVVYFVLWALIRISGRRTMGELSAFDFVLFLVIGGATQRALVGQDYSLMTAFIIVSTLIALDVLLSLVKRDSNMVSRVVDGVPMIVVENGRPLMGRMRWARITTDDVREAPRRLHGLERLDQIRFAILEAGGDISVIPDTPAMAVTWNPMPADA